ncbi:MAG: hypothetical protein WBC55_08930, partial [Dehalococcoidia bacterium]
MDGQDHTFDVYCEVDIVPQPCCWCIYASEWWAMPAQPPDPPEYREYFCLHTVELLPPEHTEDLGLLGMYTIADPSFHQECTFYGGPSPNGYGVAEWDTIPGLVRWNFILGYVYLRGIDYWNSQIDLLSWKTRYDMFLSITMYSCTLQVIPVSGNPGWPYNVGNAWLTLGHSTITFPSWTYTEVSGMEMVDCGGYIPPTMCYTVDDYAWKDADGVDNDSDGKFDEDPGGPMGNGMDDDSDGAIDEDGGDGVFDPVNQRDELHISSSSWYSNEYGCPIEKWTYPNPVDMFYGYEHLCLLWYCTDPPFPPWE